MTKKMSCAKDAVLKISKYGLGVIKLSTSYLQFIVEAFPLFSTENEISITQNWMNYHQKKSESFNAHIIDSDYLLFNYHNPMSALAAK